MHKVKKEVKDEHELIILARESIKCAMEKKDIIVNEKIKEKYSRKQACFVTLTKNGELRGCIGNLKAERELWKNIINNAIASASLDPRFKPLSKAELDKIKIEISLLSKLKQIKYKNVKELKQKIFGKGVVIKKSQNIATYLPQVWKLLSDAELFLSSLCEKAGLESDAWKKDELDVFVYGVKVIKEK